MSSLWVGTAKKECPPWFVRPISRVRMGGTNRLDPQNLNLEPGKLSNLVWKSAILGPPAPGLKVWGSGDDACTHPQGSKDPNTRVSRLNTIPIIVSGP